MHLAASQRHGLLSLTAQYPNSAESHRVGAIRHAMFVLAFVSRAVPPRPLRVLRCNALYCAAQLRRGDVRDGPRQSVGHADDHTAMPREHRASVGSVARTGRPLPSGVARKATAVAALSVAATVRPGARLQYRTDRRHGIAYEAGMLHWCCSCMARRTSSRRCSPITSRRSSARSSRAPTEMSAAVQHTASHPLYPSRTCVHVRCLPLYEP